MIAITEEQLKEILGEAFEAGWYGSKDLKESVVDGLVSKTISDLMHKRPLSDNFSAATFTVDTGEWIVSPFGANISE
jgi:hypothetical protein